jgi:hypothetical protein
MATELVLPPRAGHEPTAAEFWLHVEKAGRLVEAIALYDEISARWEEWEHRKRETKQEFAARIEREGRKEKVDRYRAQLSKAGHTEREIQETLVEKFQPLDGSSTRVWPTPDPWEEGRLFRKKSDQEELEEMTSDEDEDDRAVSKAEWRLSCAKFRRDERVALAAARRRARELAEAAKVAAKEAKTVE